jgi:hypothetical protein
MDKKYVVAYGKTLSTQKGIFEAGDAVDVSHFLNSEHMNELIENGFVQEAAEFKKISFYQGKVEAKPAPEPGIVAEEDPPSSEPPELRLKKVKKA